jgi:hypothetical protein
MKAPIRPSVGSLRVMVCVLSVTLAAAQQAPSPDPDWLGPQIGTRVPDFSGVDQFGRVQTLESVMREQGAMLVFFRSADW